MKICLYAFFPRFQLAINSPTFFFIGSNTIFSNKYDSVSFQNFLY